LKTLEEVSMGRYRQEVQEGRLASSHLTLGTQSADTGPPCSGILRSEILEWICDPDGAQKKHSEVISSHHPATGQRAFERAKFKG